MLETERLILRPWEDGDCGNLYKYASDPDVGPSAGWPPHRNLDESRRVLKSVLKKTGVYAVCLKTENKTIGSIGLKSNADTDMTEREDECELGYWLGKPYWGRGIMPEAVREILRYAFEDAGMKKVWCGYYDGNEKSKRVQEKCGFRYQWTTEQVDVPLMNEKRTGHVNAITKEQWIRDRIRMIDKNKKKYLSLLLLADEQENMIDRYLDRGVMFVVENGGTAKACCVVTDEGDDICEIKNLAVSPEIQGKGYGSAMIDYIEDWCRGRFMELQVGTGDSPVTVPFYQKCGFAPHHVLNNFFLDNYERPIFEGGKQLIDMVFLRKRL